MNLQCINMNEFPQIQFCQDKKSPDTILFHLLHIMSNLFGSSSLVISISENILSRRSPGPPSGFGGAGQNCEMTLPARTVGQK